MFSIGDKVITKDINGATYSGKIVEIDRYGFAVVSYNNISETRIQITELTKENN